jgi:predicted GIY-YIG superfamily endonuclease
LAEIFLLLIYGARSGVASFAAQQRMKNGSAMTGYHFVYLLESDAVPGHHYTGLTDDLNSRLKIHNTGGCPHTAKYRPWHIRVALAFRSREHAAGFEKYLKSHSGRAFAAKHF